MKACSTCGRLQPHDYFFRNKSKKDGYSNQCKPCHTVSAKPSWARNRVTRLSQSENARKLRNYGLTQDAYDALLSEQQGKCAICRREEAAVDRQCGKLKRLAVDHSPATGAVRGLLCQRCNLALGLLSDDPRIAQSVLDYLL